MSSEQLPDKISELVDHLRSQNGAAASLTEVASVTEVLIATMQAFFRSIDASIYRECRALSDYISTARLEIAALSPKDLENSRIPRAGMELDAIVQQTEEATDTIMTSAENILTALEGDPEKNKDAIEASVMQIFEACSFQDITGQRINKVVKTLAHIEQRIGDLKDVMGVTEEHIDAASTDTGISAHSTDELVTGPSLAGEGINQSEVDALIAGDAPDEDDPADAEAESAENAEAGTDGNPHEPAEDAVSAEAPKEDASEIAVAPAATGKETEAANKIDADDTALEDDGSGGSTTSQEEIDALFG